MNSWKVYILHFDKAFKHACHYTGITNDIDRRMDEHRKGKGARLTQILKANGISFDYSVIGEYPNYSEAKAREKHLKTCYKKPVRYCPICKALKREVKQ
jgi:predicted GIY-YIG superfamily endonuclease